MNPNDDITVRVLIEIRDSVREGLAQVNARVDQTNARLDYSVSRQDKRMTEFELRMATALLDVKASVDGVKDLLADRLDLRDRVDWCEREIGVIKNRLAR